MAQLIVLERQAHGLEAGWTPEDAANTKASQDNKRADDQRAVLRRSGAGFNRTQQELEQRAADGANSPPKAGSNSCAASAPEPPPASATSTEGHAAASPAADLGRTTEKAQARGSGSLTHET